MKKILLLFFIAIFCAKTNAQVLKKDSLALVDLYNSTNGANWVNKWDLHTPVGGWYGVGIDGNRVNALFISDNNLVGKLPASIGKLTALLDLSIVDEPLLTGKMPNGVGNLKLMLTLQLQNTGLSGVLPDTLSTLVNLESIFLSFNNFSGKVPSFEKLDKMVDCEMTDNKFTGNLPIFSSKAFPVGGAIINLDNNTFSGQIPDSYGDYNFDQLTLSNNNLVGNIPVPRGNINSFHSIIADFR